MLQFNISQKLISYYGNVGKGKTELCYLDLVSSLLIRCRVIVIILLSSVILLFIHFFIIMHGYCRNYRKYRK